MYKIIASDLDGTLIGSNGEVSLVNLEYISKLKERGIMVVPSSGRTLFEVPKVVRQHKDIDYIIFANGSGIYSKKDDKTIFYDPIPNDVKNSIVCMLNEYDTYIELYSMGHVYDDKLKYGAKGFEYYGIDEYFIPELYKSREPIENFNDYAYNDKHFVEMFNVYFHNENERQECKQRLKQLNYPVEITSSMKTSLEITHTGNSKGNALKMLCDAVGFDLKNVVAVGDSGNDITMFDVVDNGYAVANACDKLKQIATKIICSNDDNILKYLYDNL